MQTKKADPANWVQPTMEELKPRSRSLGEEQRFQVDNDLCGIDFCINPDCYCDEIRIELGSLTDEQLREKALNPETDSDYLFWTAREINGREHDYCDDGTKLYVLTPAEHQQLAERLAPVLAEMYTDEDPNQKAGA